MENRLKPIVLGLLVVGGIVVVLALGTSQKKGAALEAPAIAPLSPAKH